jgi:hypothetical protein
MKKQSIKSKEHLMALINEYTMLSSKNACHPSLPEKMRNETQEIFSDVIPKLLHSLLNTNHNAGKGINNVS